MTALASGWFFAAAAISAIVGLLLYEPVLINANDVLGGGADNPIALGALTAIALATAGLLHPLIAGRSMGSMGLSSVFVVSNSLRLRRFDADRPPIPQP